MSNQNNLCMYMVAHGNYDMNIRKSSNITDIIKTTYTDYEEYERYIGVNLIKYSPPGKILYNHEVKPIIKNLKKNCSIVRPFSIYYATKNGSIFSNDIIPTQTVVTSNKSVMNMTIGFDKVSIDKEIEFGVFIINPDGSTQKLFPLDYAVGETDPSGNVSITTTLYEMLNYMYFIKNKYFNDIPTMTISQLSCHEGNYLKSGATSSDESKVNALADSFSAFNISSEHKNVSILNASDIIYLANNESEVLREINSYLEIATYTYDMLDDKLKPMINELVNSCFDVNFDISNVNPSKYRFVCGYFNFSNVPDALPIDLNPTDLAFLLCYRLVASAMF